MPEGLLASLGFTEYLLLERFILIVYIKENILDAIDVFHATVIVLIFQFFLLIPEVQNFSLKRLLRQIGFVLLLCFC